MKCAKNNAIICSITKILSYLLDNDNILFIAHDKLIEKTIIKINTRLAKNTIPLICHAIKHDYGNTIILAIYGKYQRYDDAIENLSDNNLSMSLAEIKNMNIRYKNLCMNHNEIINMKPPILISYLATYCSDDWHGLII